MSVGLGERLREAFVLVEPTAVEEYGSGISQLAEVTTPAFDDQIARIRLGFSLDPGSESTQRFDKQLAEQGLDIAPNQNQLRRVLACCVLVERFGRPRGRRQAKSLALDSVPALVARIWDRAGHRPVHPDLVSWADYWFDNLASELRRPHQASPPTAPDIEVPAFDESVPVHQAAHAAVVAALKPVGEFSESLSQWNRETERARSGPQREALALLWWHQSSHPNVDPERVVVDAARELAGLVFRIPGPPNSKELMLRRLGKAAAARVRVNDVQDRIETMGLGTNSDLLPLLSRADELSERTLLGIEAALWIYDEMLLRSLSGDSI